MIRPGARADLGGVIDGWQALLSNGHRVDPRFLPATHSREVLRTWAIDRWFHRTHPFPPLWVAGWEDQVVGFLSGGLLAELPVLDRAPAARIDNLWVDPSCRRQALGSSLVCAFTESSRAAGYSEVEVGTLAADTQALAFWTSLGFAPWRVQLLRRRE